MILEPFLLGLRGCKITMKRGIDSNQDRFKYKFMLIMNWIYHLYLARLSQEDEEFQFYSYFTEYKLKNLKFLKACFAQFLWLSR